MLASNMQCYMIVTGVSKRGCPKHRKNNYNLTDITAFLIEEPVEASAADRSSATI